MNVDSNWFEMIPKIELHVHLEGAIPHDSLWVLVEKYGGDPDVPDIETLKNKFVFKDFSHFIETWVWKNQFLREYEDFEFIAESVARDMAAQNIRYVEMFVSPPDFHRHGLETQRLIAAIRKGLSKADEIIISLVPDLVRDFGPDNAFRTLEEIEEVRDLGIIGIGVGGSEQAYPPAPFSEVFKKARDLGFKTSIHAGEAAGPESIWMAIQKLKPDRIGHGTRAQEDQLLLAYLRTHQIPLELCPISNIKTGIVSSIATHPIGDYVKRGLIVSVNTDDPKMFGNSLAFEYRTLVTELGFSLEDIKNLVLMGIQSSWLPNDKKISMRNAFQTNPAW